MAKSATSKKLKTSSENSMIRLSKSGLKKFKFHDPKESLRDPKLISLALAECIIEGSADEFKRILASHLEIVNKDRFSKKAGIPKRTLFRMLTPKGNPTLDSIAKVMRTLKRAA